MKRFVLFVVMVLFLFGMTVFGGGKYAEVKPFLEKMAASLGKFITDLEKAENADAVAAALDAYTEVMKKLAPKMKVLMEKYPELKDETKRPEELKPMIKKMEELGMKMMGVAGKIQQFAADPKVMEANKRFMEVMESMREEPKQQQEEKKQN